MKKLISKILLSVMLITSVSACVETREDGQVSKADMGTLLGAGTGAVIGSSFGKGNGRTVGTAIGTLLGAGLGRSIGQSLDKADMAYYNRTSQNSLETAKTGQTSKWQNPDSGNYGTITPQKTYQSAGGQYCREYQQTIVVGGKSQSAYGTACRQPDGSWQVTQ